MNNCPCILCHIGRVCYRPRNSDFAPLKEVVAAIKSYEISKSPYPLCARDRKDMIAYAQNDAPKGMLHFESLECFFMEREPL